MSGEVCHENTSWDGDTVSSMHQEPVPQRPVVVLSAPEKRELNRKYSLQSTLLHMKDIATSKHRSRSLLDGYFLKPNILYYT